MRWSPGLRRGASRRARCRVGTEHEKIPFYRADHSPVPYGGERGIRALLEGMRERLGWERHRGRRQYDRPL